MTPEKQVSPVIRISQGERDASARATHLEAATGKFLVTTNERKQMSITTNFKRVTLVAIASLGLGVFSPVPSQALVLDNLAISSTTAGTATRGLSDSTTAAVVNLSFTATAADTVVVSFASLTKPALATTTPILDIFGSTVDSSVAPAAAANGVDTATSTGAAVARVFNSAISTTALTASDTAGIIAVANTYNAFAFKVSMDSVTGTRVAGTYTYTAIATAYGSGVVTATKTAVVTFTIAALATEATTVSPATSTAIISAAGGATEDAAVTGVATASTSATAVIEVKLRNPTSGSTSAGKESVTVTTTVGTVGLIGGTFGRSVILAYPGGTVSATESITVQVRPDGSVGTASITVSTPSVTFAPKTVVFYASAPTTIVATVLNNTPGAGTTAGVIGVVAKDASGNLFGGTLYTYSDTVGKISDSGTSCSYVAANSRHECSVTGVAAGLANVTIRNSAASAISSTTVSSNAVALTVSLGSASSVKLAWNKATYAPGEKATLVVTVLDSAGKSVPAATFANLFAAGGISLSTAGGNGSETLTAVSITTGSLASAALSTSADVVKAYTVYMPSSGGTVTATATGGSSLPVAGQVAITPATATVTDSAAAALAAVSALATTVASLKTLITTLTNLVLKIQKKVKA